MCRESIEESKGRFPVEPNRNRGEISRGNSGWIGWEESQLRKDIETCI